MFTLLGVSIPFLSRADALAKVKEAKRPFFIVTLNPEILLLARKDETYRDIIESADIKVVDGIGIVLIARLLYGVKIERFPGADLAQTLLLMNYKKIFLLGGTKEVNKNAINNIRYKLQVTSYKIEGLGGNFLEKEAMEEIKIFNPDILFVALGAPKQEQFIHKFKIQNSKFKIPMVGIGGTVDYWARPSLRAPNIVRHTGLEWLWRLALQPWRFPRIFKAVIIFPAACLWEWTLIKCKSEKH